MFSFLASFLPTSYLLPGWLILDTNPLIGLLQGLVGASGISVLCSLFRVHLLIEESWKEKMNEGTSSGKSSSNPMRAKHGLFGVLQFLFVTGILATVGSRVASLVVLEFCLRAVSGLLTAGPETRKFLQQLLVQSQFSLGCAISCSLHFLHEGASQRWLCLLLAAALSWYLAKKSAALLHHVVALYKLHSSQRYCGICISLLTSGCYLQPMLCRIMIIAFSVAVLAAVSIINQQFLSATEALRFWTPLTICYTLLVVYMQEEQHRLPSSQAVLNAVVVRLGGLMVLMLTVGRWADVFHILICFLGEASCLIPNMDLLDAASSQVSGFLQRPLNWGRIPNVLIKLNPREKKNFSNFYPRRETV
ncbi:transmembrane protein 82 isoform X1 [Poeciliopsis prolifica]|uniref:transmembrane protein 82 isoform X1 n=1 Tax=Poeciliopsis prolifica TaxID=188132 RepID=UPI002412F6FD|nr:transmembrane protein 82 isoform X1 [Poeciliopsis prolifica]